MARDWDLTIGAPYELSYHYVAEATCGDGAPAVLKLGVPGSTSLAEEATALSAFDGRGAVRLLRVALDRGALLLERAAPGWRAREHHDNILRGTREPWLAIDPHGVLGDLGYEVGSLLYNPDPENRGEALTALVPSRVEQFADELAMPVERVVAWGFVKAVLSDVWSAEERSPGSGRAPDSRALDVARLLLPRLA